MCDAGSFYHGKLTAKEILDQIDYVVNEKFPDKIIPCEKFKIQFARLGDPALNMDVLKVLKELPKRYNAKGLMPCISTIAPVNCEDFFKELLTIKNSLYNKGNFQLQFSIHSTNEELRDKIIPVKKWNFNKIAEYGNKFFKKGDRKITLNFATIKEKDISTAIDPKIIIDNFDPKKFILKFTPVNPTENVKKRNLKTLIDPNNPKDKELQKLFETFNKNGFETILSIGDLEENIIGSNCGQIITSKKI